VVKNRLRPRIFCRNGSRHWKESRKKLERGACVADVGCGQWRIDHFATVYRPKSSKSTFESKTGMPSPRWMRLAIRLYLQNLVAALPEEFSPTNQLSITLLAFRPTTLRLKK